MDGYAYGDNVPYRSAIVEIPLFTLAKNDNNPSRIIYTYKLPVRHFRLVVML